MATADNFYPGHTGLISVTNAPPEENIPVTAANAADAADAEKVVDYANASITDLID